MQLQPCSACRRHISAGSACPFCRDASAAIATRPTPLRRASRAMVFAGAALATSACGGKAKPAQDPEMQEQFHHRPPCGQPDPAEVERLEQEKAAAQTDEEKAALDERILQASMPVCAPYGAPPARRRMI